MKLSPCTFAKDVSGMWLLPALGYSNVNGERCVWVGWLYWMWAIKIDA